MSDTKRNVSRFAAMAAVVFFLAAAPLLRAAPPENLYASVHLTSVKDFFNELRGVASAVFPPMVVAMFGHQYLGAFGYPDFAGLSGEGVSLFFLEGGQGSGSEPVIVGLTKLAADSPVRAVLASQKDGITLEERDGWTLFAKKSEDFAAVKDLAAFVALAAQPTDFMLETKIYSSKASLAWLNAKADELVADVEEKDRAQATAWRNLFFKVLGNYESFAYGITPSGASQSLTLGMVVTPKAGSPDAKFLAAPLPAGRIEAGDTLAASGVLNYVAQFDAAATRDYIKWYNGLAADIPNEEVRKLFISLLESYDAFFVGSDGKMAARYNSFSFTGGKSDTVGILTGNYTLAGVDNAFELFYSKLLPDVIRYFSGLIGEEATRGVRADFAKGVATVQGQSVSRTRFEMPDPQQPEEKIAEEMFYTVLKGSMLMASRLENLEKLAADYAAGKAIPGNMADAFPFVANMMAKGDVNVKAMVQSYFREAVTGEGSEAILQTLANMDIPRLLFDVKTVDSARLVYRLEIPVQSLLLIGQLVGSANIFSNPDSGAPASAPAF